MSRLALLAVGIPALANAFAPPLAASRTAGVTGIRTAVCSAPTSGGEDVSSTPTRRAVLLAGALGIPALTLGTKGANAIQYDASDPRSREDYLDEQRNMKEKRYARQPTRTDTERNVKKILQIRPTMDKVNAAVKAGDAAAIDAAIGDLSIEASKKNASLGLDIPAINKAKSYMYSYASNWSKGIDSPLTADLKSAADSFYSSIADASRSAKAGDVGAAGAAVAKANEALAKYASSIEAETLNGRINTIKVSVMGLIKDDVEGAPIDSFKANKQVQKDGKDKNFL